MILVSTTRWVGMSENMRVSVILEINGCLPLCYGNKGSTTLKIVIKPPFSEILSYIEKDVFYKSIYQTKPNICKKIALCK